MEETPEDGISTAHPFTFKATNALVALLSCDSWSVKTLKDIINDTGATGLYKHPNFDKAGQAPKTLTAKKQCGFFADDSIREEFLQIRDAMANLQAANVQAPRLNILWVLKLGEHRRLVPAGLALVNTKQIIVKVGTPVNLLAASPEDTS